jgi:Heterokaryon incompatibility protein (HET)
MTAIHPAAAYTYRTLVHTDFIRLFQLQPGNASDTTLKGELTEHRLADRPEFEALSYAWGQDERQPSFLILDDSVFSISETLSAALRVFRLADKPRNLWIDAICINQQDNNERSIQVAQMSEIYKSATKVLVWLGESTADTEEALHFLRDVAANDHGLDLNAGSAGPGWFQFSGRTLKGSHEEVMQIVQSTVKPRLDDIFGREWFTRLWIIQEISLAKSATLFFGHESLEWGLFATSLCVLKAAMNTTRLGIAWLNTFERAWRVVDVKASLQVALYTFYMSPYNELANFIDIVKGQKCKDDRDRIYALLGLGLFHLGNDIKSSNGINSKIIPDYSKSPAEVYTHVARHYVLQGDLFILHHAGLWRRLAAPKGCNVQEYEAEVPLSSPDYLPSWVPDFRTPRSFERMPWFDNDFRAGLGMGLTRVALDPSTKRIHVVGKIIDIVERRMFVPGLIGASNTFEAVCDLVERCLETYLGRTPWGPTTLFDFPLTLMADGVVRSLKYDTNIEGRTSVAEVLGKYHLFNKHCKREDGEVRLKIAELSAKSDVVLDREVYDGVSEEGRKAFIFYDALLDVFEQCQFMISAGGRTGLIPMLAELGDAIFVVPGLPTPYLLRRVKGSDADFVVIGPCYVRGIMDGEVVNSTSEWETISLV